MDGSPPPQLLDAVAVGQVTPGPVFTTATFIGYILAGPRGAVVATVGMFLPSFVLVAGAWPLIARLRQSDVTAAFLDGVNVASLGLMAARHRPIGGGRREIAVSNGVASGERAATAAPSDQRVLVVAVRRVAGFYLLAVRRKST